MLFFQQHKSSVMGSLVKLENNRAVVSTFQIYEKMGYKEHRKLKEVINLHIFHFNEIGLLPIERVKPIKGSNGGRPIECYLLNEDHFLLLVLLAKNTKENIDLKVKVSKEFRRMKKELARIAVNQINEQWTEQRNTGEIDRRVETDTIKDFIIYAKDQCGSEKGCELYYSNISKMENKALFVVEQKYPNLRDVLGVTELSTIQKADHIVSKALQEGMDNKINYKEIYKTAKDRVNLFAELMGKTPIGMLTNGS